MFWVFAASGAASALMYTLIREPHHAGTLPGADGDLTVDERRLVLRWSAVLAVDMVGGSFTTNFLSYWFYLKWGMGPTQIGVLFGATRLFSSLNYYLGLRMTRRVGAIRAIALSRVPGATVNLLTPPTCVCSRPSSA